MGGNLEISIALHPRERQDIITSTNVEPDRESWNIIFLQKRPCGRSMLVDQIKSKARASVCLVTATGHSPASNAREASVTSPDLAEVSSRRFNSSRLRIKTWNSHPPNQVKSADLGGDPQLLAWTAWTARVARKGSSPRAGLPLKHSTPGAWSKPKAGLWPWRLPIPPPRTAAASCELRGVAWRDTSRCGLGCPKKKASPHRLPFA